MFDTIYNQQESASECLTSASEDKHGQKDKRQTQRRKKRTSPKNNPNNLSNKIIEHWKHTKNSCDSNIHFELLAKLSSFG